MSPAAFYTVTGRDFFPGAVALLNSLRLVGHAEPVYVLDCGMTSDQRARLAAHATIVPAPSGAPPSMLKLVAPRLHPADVAVALDADVVVTRPLGELIAAASEGRLVAFENEKPRFVAEWGELLGLGELPRRPYLMSSALVVDRELAEEVLPLVERKQAQLGTSETWLGEGGSERGPFFYADQDVLNAVIAARLAPEQVLALETRLSAIPPFASLRCTDPATLRCRYRDGAEPYLLHHYFRKPWLVRMRSNVYSRLLTRLLLAPDVALRLEPGDLPLRLRTGPAARAARLAIDIGIGAPAAIRRRLGRRPESISAWPNSPPRH